MDRQATLVVAPNYKLFLHWLTLHPETDPRDVEYVGRFQQVAGTFRPITVINGGSDDPHIMSLVRHPQRAALVTHVEV